MQGSPHARTIFLGGWFGQVQMVGERLAEERIGSGLVWSWGTVTGLGR